MPPPPPDRPTLRGLDIDAHLRDPALKQRFVTPLFDIVAPRYDSFTRLFSFGMDAAWKRTLLEAVVDVAPPRAAVLDVACGSGDLAFGVAGLRGAARPHGIEP